MSLLLQKIPLLVFKTNTGLSSQPLHLVCYFTELLQSWHFLLVKVLHLQGGTSLSFFFFLRLVQSVLFKLPNVKHVSLITDYFLVFPSTGV